MKHKFVIIIVIPILSFFGFLFLISCTEVSAKDFYVATNGNDNNPGTITAPFLTIAHARNVVRTLNQNMTENINVFLRGGYYQLAQTFSLSPQDSGTNGYFINYQSYPGELALLSGGKTVTGWQAEGKLWKAYISPRITSNRQFYINGSRAIRTHGDGTAGANQTWQNITDIEAVNHKLAWQEPRCPVASIIGTTVNINPLCYSLSKQNLTSDNEYGGFTEITWIENAFELLNSPGEWYLNKTTGWLYYYPKPGENIGTAVGVLPILETLVSANGTANNYVKNIKFQNLAFAYATWLKPDTPEGFASVQGDFSIGSTGTVKTPANVTVNYGQNILFNRNIFTHLGGVGLNIGGGSKNNTVTGNYFTDISAGGITVGEIIRPKTTDDREINRGNNISNNIIRDVALEYRGGIGIWDGFTQNNTILHNEIYNLPFQGISIGWGWGTVDPSVAKNNTVAYNNIYHVCTAFGDCGGLYSLGGQPGNSYIQNYIHDISSVPYRAPFDKPYCLYLDNGSAYLSVHNNLLTQCAQDIITERCTTGCDISDNNKNAGGAGITVQVNAGVETAYKDAKNLLPLPSPPAISPPTLLSTSSPVPSADLNHDGKVDINDYNLLIANFGNPYTIYDYAKLAGVFPKANPAPTPCGQKAGCRSTD